MKKIHVIYIIQMIIYAIIATLNIALGVAFEFKTDFYYSTIILLFIAQGILSLIIIAVKETVEPAYTSSKVEPIIYISHIIIGAVIYYLLKFLGQFDKFIILYWISAVIGFIAPIIICLLFNNFKKDKKEDGPKFLVNKKN